jgi:hypothetical protein
VVDFVNQTDAQITGALVRWLTTRTALKVIQGEQGGDKVTLPYVMVRFTGSFEIREHAQDIEYAEDVPSARVMARPVMDTEWRFSVHEFGSSQPSDILRPIRAAAQLAQINEPLMPGVIIHELSEIRNVPELVGQAWEPRAQMDLFVHGLTKDGHLVDTIEEYSVTVNRVKEEV